MSARGFQIHTLPGRLKAGGWEHLLIGWSRLVRYATEDDDVPYWYGERPLTGLLAAAAWKRPYGWALEEFAGRRGKRLKTKSGRGDLWLGLGKRTYTIEAKVKWPPSDAEYVVQYARTALGEARKQLWKLSAQYRSRTTLIAICYLVPCPMKNGPHATLAQRPRMITAVVREFASERSIVATYFPNYDPPTDNGRAYPGVILIGKVVSWG